jgi:site-specific DNA-methyltransferase (adenine-specific)
MVDGEEASNAELANEICVQSMHVEQSANSVSVLGGAEYLALDIGSKTGLPCCIGGACVLEQGDHNMPMPDRALYLGDNLDHLGDRERFPDECIDLIYLDPPFNSQRHYNTFFTEQSGMPSGGPRDVFLDSWEWGAGAQATLEFLTSPGASTQGVPASLTDIVNTVCRTFPQKDIAAYVVLMAMRLLEMHRVLKRSGSLYLHCDPTASHYLKMVLDAIFGPDRFLSEIIWKRTGAHSSAKRPGPVHDVILLYTKTDDYKWNQIYTPHDPAYIQSHYTQQDVDGRRWMPDNLTASGQRNGSSGQTWHGYDVTAKGNHWKFTIENLEALDADGKIYWPKAGGWPRYKRYLDEVRGIPIADVWTDISPINAKAEERIGYPTQKPLALLERIIKSSSDPGDLVLDPFCGCGTAIHAAQRLGRRWIGLDIAWVAIEVIETRMSKYFPKLTFEFDGRPKDVSGARALAKRSKHNFQEWGVRLLGAAQTGRGGRHVKYGGDRGVDGRLRFSIAPGRIEKAIISVKGGEKCHPKEIRELIGTLRDEGASIGVLFTLQEPSAGMRRLAAAQGTVSFEGWNKRYQKIQLISVADAFAGTKVDFPGQAEAPPNSDAPPGSLPGENMILPGIEAGRQPIRKATVVELSREAFKQAPAARKGPKRSPRVQEAGNPMKGKPKS